MAADPLTDIVSTVQQNCDIADARYAGEDTLCIYLLRMRDYYHWISGLPMQSSVDREALGQWISDTEQRWEDLEEREFAPLPLPRGPTDVFDTVAINKALHPLGYTYSAGLGRHCYPVFFVGKLAYTEEAGSQRVLVSGRELARGLIAPPAASRGGEIVIRRDALRRYLHGMVEECSMNKGRTAMARAISHYDFDHHPVRAMEAMVEHELENLILHEIGEQVAGDLIGERWHPLLASMENPVDEIRARAVRDNLADCATSLPSFLALGDTASLDFYYANMTPLRRQMFPGFCDAYCESRARGEFSRLSAVIRDARHYWLDVGRNLVSKFDRQSSRKSADALHEYLAGSAF